MLDWLKNDLSLTIASCEPASSDASFRRYFRVKTEYGPFIVMDAPPEKESSELFVSVAALLAGSQVNVPVIFQKNLNDGFLLLEDFGSMRLLDRLTPQSANALYSCAFDELLKLQTNVSLDACNLPHYDASLLKREMNLFEEWFLNQWLGIQVPESLWETVRTLMIDSAMEQPVVCVHRDYHSRNLMALSDSTIGVIDFQDAVIGPITYDLVSLLRDCYIDWPDRQVNYWRNDYYQRLLRAKIIDCSLACFKRWFDFMGMQRHLKAMGIFSRLHIRDGKSGYLNDIPRTMNYLVSTCKAYPELTDFGNFLQAQAMPR